ncbi:Maf family protein [Dermacoccus barathri]|uniref:Nucleoside triphosphate pyrophosphatase n=1 Tax=Dermacoccus barathri TaxID=322601 RepID=A0ABN2C602_9MICO
MTQLVLASQSPARLATLRSAGVEPYVLVSEVDEGAALAAAREAHGDLAPEDVALLLANAKCQAVASRLAAGEVPDDAPDDALVLGCDSVLEFDGQTLGKPLHADDATARWRAMRGKSATLYTGHWVIDDRADGTGATFGAVSGTEVHFAEITDAEIEAYVATGEPLLVAGAFTIDGLAGPYIERIEGDPHTVVGIGLPLLREMFAEIGVEWHTLWNRPRG